MGTTTSTEHRDLPLRVIQLAQLTAEQTAERYQLRAQCFADVTADQLREDFVAPSIASVLAYEGEALVGCASVVKRGIAYEGKAIQLGGIGGVCTRADRRGRGIGSRVCQSALDLLRKEGCDVVFLAAGQSAGTARFYARLGFVLLGRPFTFVDARGAVKHPSSDDVGMIAPLCSADLFAHIVNGATEVHLGPEPGYW
jgi:predicted N-acetyltransferase YhbS